LLDIASLANVYLHQQTARDMKTKLNYSDENYKSAVNYEQDLYNYPVTLDIDGKLYILGCGSSDSITIKVKKGICYVLGVNRGLSYISLTIIDTRHTDNDNQWLIDSLYWDNSQIEEIKPKLLDMSTNYQIRYLAQWF
jgi:hypothetical protein